MTTAETTVGPIDWHRAIAAVCMHPKWSSVAQHALGSKGLGELVGGALQFIGVVVAAEAIAAERAAASSAANAARASTPKSQPDPPPMIPDDEPATELDPPAGEIDFEPPDPAAVEAASILGVVVDASEDAIRAALRVRLSSSRLHPDHGGDGEEAKRLIAAKNLLIERARASRA